MRWMIAISSTFSSGRWSLGLHKEINIKKTVLQPFFKWQNFVEKRSKK
jgi:hypothetical protein